MKALQNFTFNPSNQTIRVEMINNEPWFAAKDVCACLGLDNSRQAASKLDDDEKGVIISDTLGGTQRLGAVNESGLYNLIFQSRKPEAKAFRKWVTGEVLPAIRKTGQFVAAPQKPTRQYIKRGELVNVEILNLLWLIGEFLQHGDINRIAMELGVSRQTVSRVLNGQQRNSRVLTALYNRARENRKDGLLDFYYSPKQMRDRLLGVSNGGRDRFQRMLDDEVVPGWEIRHRGGQPGNKNARKLKK